MGADRAGRSPGAGHDGLDGWAAAALHGAGQLPLGGAGVGPVGSVPLLHADAVAWRYRGGRWLFRDLSVRLTPGQLLRVQGGNGSGKSTLLRLLAGCVAPRRGTVALGERAAYLPQLARRLPAVPAGRLSTYLSGAGAAADPLLAGHLDTPADRLSAGTARRLLLNAVLGLPSRLLVLDEPAAGLDSAAVRRLTTRLGDRLASGGAVVLADHQRLPLTETVLIDLGGGPAPADADVPAGVGVPPDADVPAGLMQVLLAGEGTFHGQQAHGGQLRLWVPADECDALLADALRAGWSVRGVHPLAARGVPPQEARP